MSAMPRANASKLTSSKKRNPGPTDSGRPIKQAKIDSYFVKRHPVSSSLGRNERQFAMLNDEQERVLKMVIDGGESVFFTGAAGTRFLYITPLFLSSLTQYFLLTRHWEVSPAPSYCRFLKGEICKKTCCCFHHSKHWNGRFKHWRYVLPLPCFFCDPCVICYPVLDWFTDFAGHVRQV